MGAARFNAMIPAVNRGDAVAVSAGGEPPALFTHTSIRPKRSRVRSITASGGTAVAVAADLARQVDRRSLVATVEDQLGPVDVLVNNAAITYFEPVEQFQERHYGLMFEVQVRAPFELAQLVVPGMRPRKATCGCDARARRINTEAAAASSMPCRIPNKSTAARAIVPLRIRCIGSPEPHLHAACRDDEVSNQRRDIRRVHFRKSLSG